MRRQVLLAATALSLALAGCQDALSPAAMDADQTADSASMAAAPETRAVGADEAVSPQTAPSVPDAQVPRLAYSYRYTLEAPNRAVPSLAANHERACAQAGPAVCQIIGSSVQRTGDDQQVATLDIRATPQWLAAFRGGLESEVEAADGRIADQATESEDLTRALIDTEAHLNAKRALRDRLQTMLTTRTGDLQSALEVERELARVQGEIDAAQSQLAVMRARVDMSRLTLTYQSAGVLAPDSALTPLSDAVEGALGVIMIGFAAMIWTAAFVLPFALVIGPIVWFWLRRRRKTRPSPPAGEGGGPST